jgi:hypothetical protein
LIVAKGNIVLVLYHLHAKLSTNCVNALQKQDACDLWHKRPEHMSDKGMKVLVKKKVLKGSQVKKCSNCLAVKEHRVAFKSQSPHKKPEVLDFVHSDVRKMTMRSNGGSKYLPYLLMNFLGRFGSMC